MAPIQKRATFIVVTLLIVWSSIFTTGLMVPASTNSSIIEPQSKPEKAILIEHTYYEQEVYAAYASEVVTQVEVEVAITSSEPTQKPTLDRTKPIYQVYKDGYVVEVPTEWQWYIRDMAEQYDFDEKIIFGCILAESCFNPKTAGDSEKSLGLAQIQKFWIRGAAITHFTEDYCDRDLLNPYDNILTLMEIWSYARETYSLDLSTELGIKQLLYWHNTGKDPTKVTKWQYSTNCIKYASELILIQE